MHASGASCLGAVQSNPPTDLVSALDIIAWVYERRSSDNPTLYKYACLLFSLLPSTILWAVLVLETAATRLY